MSWSVESLSSLASGGLFCDGDWVESKDQDPEGDVRLTQLADVGVGVFRDRSDRRLREDQAARLNCTFLQPDDILIARMPDPIGRACLVPPGIGRAVTVVDVAVLRIARPDLDPRFVMWAINSPARRQLIESMQSGTTRKRVSRRNLSTVSIAIPELDEQRRIVDILEDHLSRLDAAEAYVESCRRRVALLRVSALLSERRALMEGGAPIARLGDVATTALGKMLDAKNSAGTPSGYLRNVNVRWGSFDLTDVASVPLTATEKERFDIRDGDLLVCEGGEPGRCAVWRGDSSGLTYQKALHRVRPNSGDVSSNYLALMLESVVRGGEADRLFTGTTIKHLPQEKLRQIEIPLPDIATQVRVVESVRTLAERSDELEKQRGIALQRSAALRRALLAAAFSGQLTGTASDSNRIEELAAPL